MKSTAVIALFLGTASTIQIQNNAVSKIMSKEHKKLAQLKSQAQSDSESGSDDEGPSERDLLVETVNGLKEQVNAATMVGDVEMNLNMIGGNIMGLTGWQPEHDIDTHEAAENIVGDIRSNLMYMDVDNLTDEDVQEAKDELEQTIQGAAQTIAHGLSEQGPMISQEIESFVEMSYRHPSFRMFGEAIAVCHGVFEEHKEFAQLKKLAQLEAKQDEYADCACGEGQFCNNDDGPGKGFCENCADAPAAGCWGWGLPELGAQDCDLQCNGIGSEEHKENSVTMVPIVLGNGYCQPHKTPKTNAGSLENCFEHLKNDAECAAYGDFHVMYYDYDGEDCSCCLGHGDYEIIPDAHWKTYAMVPSSEPDQSDADAAAIADAIAATEAAAAADAAAADAAAIADAIAATEAAAAADAAAADAGNSDYPECGLCGEWSFCNMDGGPGRGFCEYCGDAPDGDCWNWGLPELGAMECDAVCHGGNGPQHHENELGIEAPPMYETLAVGTTVVANAVLGIDGMLQNEGGAVEIAGQLNYLFRNIGASHYLNLTEGDASQITNGFLKNAILPSVCGAMISIEENPYESAQFMQRLAIDIQHSIYQVTEQVSGVIDHLGIDLIGDIEHHDEEAIEHDMDAIFNEEIDRLEAEYRAIEAAAHEDGVVDAAETAMLNATEAQIQTVMTDWQDYQIMQAQMEHQP